MKLRTSPPPYGAVVVALVGIGIAAVGFADGPSHPATWAAVIGGLIITALATVLLVWGGEHVVIDVPAGMVHYLPINQHKRASLPVSELGELTIVTQKRDPHRYRHQVLWQRLHASGLGEAVLFEALDRAKVDARKVEIERLVDAAMLRPILAAAHGDKTAFRSAPDIESRAKEIVPDAARLRAAIDQLARDRDADVRARALEMRGRLAA